MAALTDATHTATTTTPSHYTHTVLEQVPASNAAAPPLLRLEELPNVLRFALRMTGSLIMSNKLLDRLVETFFVGVGFWWFSLALWQLTSSLEVAALMHVLFMFSYLVPRFNMPDYSNGDTFAVRELLGLSRSDVKRFGKRLRVDVRNMWIGNIIIVVVFGVVGLRPFATSETWGQHTFAITLVSCLFSLLCFVASFVRFTCQFLPNLLLLAWSRRIKKYVLNMREILLRNDDGGHKHSLETGMGTSFAIAEALSLEQEKNEEWARRNIRSLAPYASGQLAVTFIVVVASLITLAGRPGTEEKRANSIAALSLIATVFGYYFFHNCRLISFINLKWNRLTVKYLNDAKIQQRLISRGWTPERFERFMDNHVINAQVVFGAKVTAARMRAVGGVAASAFALIFYFILREEVRELAGVTTVRR
jgi:hypothetical protein